jgi:hypothetical protein
MRKAEMRIKERKIKEKKEIEGSTARSRLSNI